MVGGMVGIGIGKESMTTQTKPICPKCESHNVQYRKSDQTLWCRRCGEEWPRPRDS
jgi:ribosomal protein L37AE/L43A